MDPFQVVLLEGRFFATAKGLCVEQVDRAYRWVDDVLAPLVGQQVQLAVHHVPPQGIQSELPGAGSCLWPKGRGCPVQHDQYPDRLLAFQVEGLLCRDPWRLEKPDGAVVPIPFAWLPGHYGRVAGTTLGAVEQMRDSQAWHRNGCTRWQKPSVEFEAMRKTPISDVPGAQELQDILVSWGQIKGPDDD